MLLFKYLAVKIVFSILFLSSTGNDNNSKNSEHKFVSSLATNKNIVSDAIEGQSKLQNSITDSFAENCPLYFNTLKQCFPALKKNNSSFELYNLTEETKKQNVTAERENLRVFGKSFFRIVYKQVLFCFLNFFMFFLSNFCRNNLFLSNVFVSCPQYIDGLNFLTVQRFFGLSTLTFVLFF